jgi:hypothetical protein
VCRGGQAPGEDAPGGERPARCPHRPTAPPPDGQLSGLCPVRAPGEGGFLDSAPHRGSHAPGDDAPGGGRPPVGRPAVRAVPAPPSAAPAHRPVGQLSGLSPIRAPGEGAFLDLAVCRDGQAPGDDAPGGERPAPLAAPPTARRGNFRDLAPSGRRVGARSWIWPCAGAATRRATMHQVASVPPRRPPRPTPARSGATVGRTAHRPTGQHSELCPVRAPGEGAFLDSAPHRGSHALDRGAWGAGRPRSCPISVEISISGATCVVECASGTQSRDHARRDRRASCEQRADARAPTRQRAPKPGRRRAPGRCGIPVRPTSRILGTGVDSEFPVRHSPTNPIGKI